jgi:hypothetical protein
MKFNPLSLMKDAEKETYVFINKYYKKLPMNNDGTFNKSTGEFVNNDIDAIRHSFVSGIFSQEYGEKVAEFFGILNERKPNYGNSKSKDLRSENMDLWNNKIGRKYGKKTTSRIRLFKLILKALKNGELIINLDDPRRYFGKILDKENLKSKVIVIKESKKGKNLFYFDIDKNLIMSKNDFVTQIKNGAYPRYETRIVNSEETPVSKKDKFTPNNLG